MLSCHEMRSRLTKVETENANLRTKLSMMRERNSAEPSPQLMQGRSITPTGMARPRFSLLNQTPGARISGSNLRTTPLNSNGTATASDDVFTTGSGHEEPLRARSADLPKTVRWSTPIASSHSFINFDQSSASSNNVSHNASQLQYNVNRDMINTKYELTSRGNEYTFSNGPIVTRFVELNCHCTVYEYCNSDFRWVGRAGSKSEIYYHETGKVYDITTPSNTRIRLFATRQVEVHWANGDLTLVSPDGKRTEMFQSERSDEIRFEVYEPESGAYWWTTHTEPQIFTPNVQRMSQRSDGSFMSLVENNSLQLKAPDFLLRRLAKDGFMRIHFPESNVQISFCAIDNVLVVKHVLERKDGAKNKLECYSPRHCNHFARQM